jgi:dTDP-glucose 4,6-dehydratase
MSERILITGASGFVGSHVTRYMSSKGYEIVGLCRDQHSGNAQRIAGIPNIKIVFHDLRQQISSTKWSSEIGKIDYIFHIAANSHVERSIHSPLDFVYDNVVGTANLLEAVRFYNRDDLKGFFNFSTDEVYGPAPLGYDHTESDRHRPSNPYSGTKSAQESIAYSYFITYGIPVITTNTMNIFGEGQHPEKFISMCIENFSNKKPQIIHSLLKNNLDYTEDKNMVESFGSRYWLYVENVSSALNFLIKSGLPGHTYNIVGDIEKNNEEVALDIANIMDVEPKLIYQDFHKSRPGHDRRYALDGFKLKNMGWKPEINYTEGLKRTVLNCIKGL